MKKAIAYLVLLALASLPAAFMVLACYLPMLAALPCWGIGGIGVSILVGAAWEIHKENKEASRNEIEK